VTAVHAAAKILTEIQQMMAPLTHAKFDAQKTYSSLSQKLNQLRALHVDESLLSMIDFQSRVILNFDAGDPQDAMASLLNEIAIWKEENAPA
jgi:hypothetical protein